MLFRSDSRTKILLNAMRQQMINDRRDSRWYASSFTDSWEYEHHWSDHAVSDTGVCIVFDSREIIRFLSPSPQNRILPVKITYETQEMVTFGNLALTFAIDNFKRDYAHIGDGIEAANQFLAA